MFLLQVLNEPDTEIYAVCFEIDEIQPSARVGGIELAGEIDQFRKGAADLPMSVRLSVRLGEHAGWRGREGGREATHIDGNVADYPLMMWKSNILTLMVDSVGVDGRLGARFVVHYKCALDVDLDGTGIGNRFQPAGTGVGGMRGILDGGAGGRHDELKEELESDRRIKKEKESSPFRNCRSQAYCVYLLLPVC